MKTPRFLIVILLAALLVSAAPTQALSGQPPAIQALDEFKIVELTTDDAHVIDHDAITGDDRGGIATSTTRVLVTGDDATGSFALADLGGGFDVGAVYDMLVSDLKTAQIYLLGHNDAPVPTQAGDQTVSQLLLVDGETGAPTGEAITLDPAFTLNTGYGTGALFAGFGRLVVYDGINQHIWSIETPSGDVTDIGFSALPYYYGCESWAIWGIAEYDNGEDYLVYRGDGEEIWRTRVSDGDTTVVAAFANLSDMCSLTAAVHHSRWYFHHESSSQFGGTDETLGYARAVFQFPGGDLEGYVYDDLTATPIAGATVSAGNFQANTDEQGYYAMRLIPGTYTVTAAHPLYQPASVADVEIVLDQLVALDFDLLPRVTFAPASVDVTLSLGATKEVTASIHNYTAVPYDFLFDEMNKGFVPLVAGSAIALVSDDFELMAITSILDDLELDYDEWYDEDTNLYLEDPTFLADYGVIVWYTHDRETTQDEHDALEDWLQQGGRLLVTGYDSLGSPDDPLLADLVRSSGYGDDARSESYEILLDHPITDGPYGVYPIGTQLSIYEYDQDNAVADTARGAEAIATLVGEPYDKIIATDLGTGIVVYWNGNYECDDWLDADGQILFKNALHWLVGGGDVLWFGQVPVGGTVPAGADLDVTLVFTATLDAGVGVVGDYSATLLLRGDPLLRIPVQMTVVLLDQFAFLPLIVR